MDVLRSPRRMAPCALTWRSGISAALWIHPISPERSSIHSAEPDQPGSYSVGLAGEVLDSDPSDNPGFEVVATAINAMADRVATYDWSSNVLGPKANWPLNLQTAVGICLNTRFPMRVWWGPELINIYNDAYALILGDRHPMALGASAKVLWASIWPTLQPQVDAVMVRGESTWQKKFLLTLENNGVKDQMWLAWSYSPIRNADGSIAGMMCCATEETARILADRERQKFAEERERMLRVLEVERSNLAGVIEKAPAFIATLRGPQHIFELANEKYYELLGRRDIVGRTVLEAIPEVKEQGFIDLLDRVYSTGEPCVGSEVPLTLTTDGKTEFHFVNFVYQAIRGGDGSIIGIFVHGVDVTSNVRARDDLKEREARFRNLADAMPQIVWAANRDGALDYYNRRWFEFIHRTELTDPKADAVRWDGYVHPDDLPRAGKAWEASLISGDIYSIEFRVRDGAGTYQWFLVRALPVRGTDGQITRWYGTCTNIEDRRRVEAEMEQLLASERAARTESELQSRMKDEFLATLSHEIRTPLNAILGWSQIMRVSNDPDDIATGLEVIERNARAQSQIVEDLLDMSRIISGKVRLDVQRLDLASIVQAAVETARPTAETKGVRIRSVIDPLHGVAVSGDGNRLQQILWNLISNAIKFTPKGGLVRVLLERVNSHLEICVIDTGEGISAEFLPYVFDRFRQADSTTTRRHGGLGLGLSIVRQLVELHGGSVRVKSPGVGLGATFVVSLPMIAIHSGQESDGERQHPRVSQPTRTVEPGMEIRGVRVLVIDDESDARALVKRLLEDCKAVVTATASPDEVIQLVMSGNFDVLVSDIGMPNEDGYSLIKRVRALGKGNGGDIPAIALTAYARSEDRIKAVAAGFLMHVAKPVEPAELVTMVAAAAGHMGSVGN